MLKWTFGGRKSSRPARRRSNKRRGTVPWRARLELDSFEENGAAGVL